MFPQRDVERFIEWFERTYERKPVPEDKNSEFAVWIAHDLSITRERAQFYLDMATRPKRPETETELARVAPTSAVVSGPVIVRVGRPGLKIGDRVQMRAHGTAGDPDGSGAQVVLNAEITGIIENIDDTNVAIRVEPSPVRGHIPRTRTPTGEQRELPGQRQLMETHEIARSYVRIYEDFLAKFPGKTIDSKTIEIWFTDAVMKGNNKAVNAALPKFNRMSQRLFQAAKNLDELIQMVTEMGCAGPIEEQRDQ